MIDDGKFTFVVTSKKGLAISTVCKSQNCFIKSNKTVPYIYVVYLTELSCACGHKIDLIPDKFPLKIGNFTIFNKNENFCHVDDVLCT